MIKNIFLFILLLFFLPSWAEEKSEKKYGYRYIIDNYFAKRKAEGSYSNYSRNFILSLGTAFYRESTEQSFKPFSSNMLSFNQKIKEIYHFGDFNLHISLFSSQMRKQRATLIEITPRISIPEIRTAFPLYIGAGVGMGLYPYHIVRKLPSLSINSHLFIGLRFFDLYHNLGLSAEIILRVHSPLNELKIYMETLGVLGLICKF